MSTPLSWFRPALVVGLVIVPAFVLHAQWVSLGPTGFCSSVAITDRAIFGGTIGGGVFVSVDSGKSWRDVSPGLTNLNVTALASEGTVVYAATDGGGILRTTDNGSGWTLLDNYMISSRINAIAVFGDTLLAGPIGYGPFASTDGGSFWFPGGRGIAGATVTSFVRIDSFYFAGTTGNGLNRWKFGDSVWSHLSVPGPAKAYISGLTPIGGRILASAYGYGIFVSSDRGETWETSTTAAAARVTVALGTARRTTGGGGLRIFAGTANFGVFVSDDSARTWRDMDLGLISNTVSGFASHGSAISAATDDGVFSSTNAGETWTAPGRGLATSSISSFAFDGPALLAGSTHQGAFLTTDRGGTWTRSNDGLPNTEISSLLNYSSKIFAGTTVGTIYYREQGSTTWTNTSSGLPGGYINALGISGTVLLAAPGIRGVYYSSDGGNTWRPGQGTTRGPGGTVATGFASLEGTAYASTEGLAVLKSTDGGKTWMAVSDIPDVPSLSCIVVKGSRLIAGAPGGPRVSDDRGQTWRLSATGMAGIQPTALFVYDRTILATTNANGIFASVDDGQTWHAVGQGLPATRLLSVITDGSDVYVGTALAGVWRRPLAEILLFPPAPGGEPGAEEVMLSQNYPNPFNPVTTVEFRILTSELATLRVYDMLGREVATLVDGVRNPGTYTLRFDGSNLASGMYYYRLTTGGRVETRKMLLVR